MLEFQTQHNYDIRASKSTGFILNEEAFLWLMSFVNLA